MSTLSVTTINTANGTTDMTVATGNTLAPKLVVYSNGTGSFTNGLVKSNGFINGSQSIVTGITTLTSACFGTMIQATGGPYTVTLPSPVSFNGACFQFWTNTSSIITLSTPAGTFAGPNGSAASTLALTGTSMFLLASDGFNWIITNTSTLAPNLVYLRNDTRSLWNFATAGQTGTFIADLNTTITPRKSTSKVLVTYCIFCEANHDTVFKLYRQVGGVDTEIGTNSTDASYWSGVWTLGYDSNDSSTAKTVTLMYLDSPSTTSPITYKLMIQSSGIASYLALNRTMSSAGQYNYEVGISQVFLEEYGV